MRQNEATVLSDRQIRNMCEVPVGVLQFLDLRERGVENRVHVPFFENELVDLSTHIARLGKIYAGNEHVEQVDRFDEVWIARTQADFKPMISPFSPTQVRARQVQDAVSVREPDGSLTQYPILDVCEEKIISWGTSSYGYDVRCAEEFKIFTNINSTMIDPKNFDSLNFVEHKGEFCIIPPNSFVLARTVEHFRIPRDVVANCLGKSTYARCGISVMVTPLEPEWEGYLTLEFANTTPLPAKLYANEGCAQIQFFRGSEACEVSYKDRGGKYQNQIADAIPPRV